MKLTVLNPIIIFSLPCTSFLKKTYFIYVRKWVCLHIELIHFTWSDWLINKRNNKCWLGCRGKAPPIHHSGKYKSVHSLQKSLWILPKKIKLTLPYYPAILFLGTCLRDSMLAWHRDACSSMFLVVLFTITNLCK